MHAAILLVASTTMGVGFGWQPAGNGGLEYIIQVEPTLADRMQDGEVITSELPPEVRGMVRRFRVQIGTDALPRTGLLHDVRKETPRPKLDERGFPRATYPEEDARFNDRTTRAGTPRSGTIGAGEPTFGPREESRYDDSNAFNRRATDAFPANTAKSPDAKSDPNKTESGKGDAAKSDAGTSATAGMGIQTGWAVVAIVGLFVSLGANLYQGWLLTTHRRHYDRLVNTLYARNPSTAP